MEDYKVQCAASEETAATGSDAGNELADICHAKRPVILVLTNSFGCAAVEESSAERCNAADLRGVAIRKRRGCNVGDIHSTRVDAGPRTAEAAHCSAGELSSLTHKSHNMPKAFLFTECSEDNRTSSLQPGDNMCLVAFLPSAIP